MAGVIPALILASLYAAVVLGWGLLRPNDAPRGPRPTMGQAVRAAFGLSPLLVLIFVVLGGIYFGVFTPTEDGGIGVMGAVVLAMYFRKLTWTVLWEAATPKPKPTA